MKFFRSESPVRRLGPFIRERVGMDFRRRFCRFFRSFVRLYEIWIRKSDKYGGMPLGIYLKHGAENCLRRFSREEQDGRDNCDGIGRKVKNNK